MAERTIHLFDRSQITVTNLAGAAPRNGNVIANALNGNAFSWEVPDDLRLTFPTATVALTFDDADGVLSDDPYANANVIDQRLTQPVSIAGTSYAPSASTVRWQWPAPVAVENEYEVVLFDAAGTAYRMVGVSITQGYASNVVGVMFEGAQPPAGVALYYRQGVSSYADRQSAAIPDGAVCFLAGTRIDTPEGPRPIETLSAGDLVLTLDHGPQPLRWVGRSAVDGTGKLAPVRIAAGVLGNRRDLFVSPNHALFLRSPMAELWFGEAEVLVAAKHLVNGTTIRQVPRPVAHYLHLALDRHDMVFAEGIASESLHAGPMALAALTPEARDELLAIFPDLPFGGGPTGRRSLRAPEARVLLSSASAEGRPRQTIAAE